MSVYALKEAILYTAVPCLNEEENISFEEISCYILGILIFC